MATYTELKQLFSDEELRDKVDVAIIIAADTIRGEDVGTTYHAERLVWAKTAFASPRSKSDEMLMAILAVNSSASVEQITEASDATIQSQVDAVVNMFTV